MHLNLLLFQSTVLFAGFFIWYLVDLVKFISERTQHSRTYDKSITGHMQVSTAELVVTTAVVRVCMLSLGRYERMLTRVVMMLRCMTSTSTVALDKSFLTCFLL